MDALKIAAMPKPKAKPAKPPAPKRLTVRRGVKFMLFWTCCIFALPAVLVVGVVWGAIQGIGSGLTTCSGEALRDLRKVWASLELD